MNIVFMGTPDFAVPSLDILIKNQYKIVGVVTAVDKPAGRGNKIFESPIKKYALSKGLKLLQPEKLKSEDFIKELSDLKPDLIVVVAFRMLPEVVWKMPVKGTFNLHGSLLPKYRGAAPINWALINGEIETGVTTFFIDQEIDTGKIIFFDKINIGENDTAGDIHDKLMLKGADLVLKTVRAIEGNNYELVSQDQLYDNQSELKQAPKINKEICRINWNNDNVSIHNHVRGLSPFPGAWTEMYINQELMNVKIFRTEKVHSEKVIAPGKIESDEKSFIHVGTGNGIISVLNIQIPGKKRLYINEFLRGFKNIEQYSFI